ncbi:hypothetical protein EPI10_020269 [Gossypium australe]|uniref:Uncharacterized protein n=1 Tax=Gossypium australe TaxID=47621 RepID=A0A5B6WES2_9ROSI|nr:hypothetical protein EPI10_020269 [Gossypium australe]
MWMEKWKLIRLDLNLISSCHVQVNLHITIAVALDYKLKEASIKFTNCLDPYMDLSKHLAHVIKDLIKRSRILDLNVDEPCVYKCLRDGNVVFLVLYVDEIL